MDIPPGWQMEGESIEKDFKFKDFLEALSFVNKVADLAEAANHHPDILIHKWRYVKFTLTTHSEGKLTSKDTSLALKINDLSSQLKQNPS